MKLIPVPGTSLSAAGPAMGFAMIGDQALGRDSNLTAAPARPVLIASHAAIARTDAFTTLPLIKAAGFQYLPPTGVYR